MVQTPGQHVPPINNRSSKQYIKLTKIKPVVKSMRTDRVQALAKAGDREASRELTRRNKKMAKRKVDVPSK